MARFPLFLFLPVMALMTFANGARAQPEATAAPVVEEARAHFDAGVALSEEERWSEALDAFRRSRALVERPSTIFNIATALQRLGRASDAMVAVDAFLAVADPVRDGAQLDQARALRDALHESLARVTVRLSPGTAELAIDARPLGASGSEHDVRDLELDPGDHVLEISAPGFARQTIELALAPGARVEQQVTLERIEVTPAEITVRASRDDARIVVDDEDVGVGHAVVQLGAGRHVVRVEALQHRLYQRIVELAPAERIEILAPLERVSGGSIAEEPAFWIVAAGIVAAGVGVGVGLGVTMSAGTSAPYGGSSGIAITGLTTPW